MVYLAQSGIAAFAWQGKSPYYQSSFVDIFFLVNLYFLSLKEYVLGEIYLYHDMGHNCDPFYFIVLINYDPLALFHLLYKIPLVSFNDPCCLR